MDYITNFFWLVVFKECFYNFPFHGFAIQLAKRLIYYIWCIIFNVDYHILFFTMDLSCNSLNYPVPLFQKHPINIYLLKCILYIYILYIYIYIYMFSTWCLPGWVCKVSIHIDLAGTLVFIYKMLNQWSGTEYLFFWKSLDMWTWI